MKDFFIKNETLCNTYGYKKKNFSYKFVIRILYVILIIHWNPGQIGWRITGICRKRFF